VNRVVSSWPVILSPFARGAGVLESPLATRGSMRRRSWWRGTHSWMGNGKRRSIDCGKRIGWLFKLKEGACSEQLYFLLGEVPVGTCRKEVEVERPEHIKKCGGKAMPPDPLRLTYSRSTSNLGSAATCNAHPSCHSCCSGDCRSTLVNLPSISGLPLASMHFQSREGESLRFVLVPGTRFRPYVPLNDNKPWIWKV
jgi:hypothetical protein